MGDDSGRFEHWYKEAHPRVVTSLLLVTGNIDTAHELADEAFARAFLHWARVSEMASPTGWTCRVAFNLARRRGRRATLERALLRKGMSQPSVPPPAGEAWLAVQQLPPRQRTTVVLRYVADLKEGEIADFMGISRSTVSSSLAAARRSLGHMLADEDADIAHEELDHV
jgi:RNA polymerase sigma-70 factor (ECF subfamily)